MSDPTQTPNEPQTFWGGLLSGLNSPMGQGLLSAAAAGFAGAKRGQPMNNFGRALQGGLLGYANAKDELWQEQTRAMQLRQLERQKQLDDLAKQFYKGPAQPPIGGQPAMTGSEVGAPSGGLRGGGFDMQGYADAAFAIDPKYAISIQASLAKESPFGKVDPKDYTPESLARFSSTRNFGDLQHRSRMEVAPGGQVWDPYQTAPGTSFVDPNKPFSLDSSGQPKPNLPFQRYSINKAKAGAPSTVVKIDNKTGESLASQIGPMLKESYTAAQGAVQTADAANRVVQAVDSGQVIAGPFANGRLAVTQMADVFGIGGKDNAERIAKTRQTIRGLAEMTLQGRKQMTGQGAITESESKLAERAMSGDIELTPAEIRQLAAASARAAKWTYEQHQSQLMNLEQDPNLSKLAKFYKAPAFPATQSQEINFEDLK